ncbi:T3SS effector HopA1 family protein [uncultured Jatrophihabitans sp.]|uniref:T3SS effector HopA1 family protein n=1 Tax=uncultured Jatrophihabitans sp. TaxID=1610747 RepID=UPI0035CA9F7A
MAQRQAPVGTAFARGDDTPRQDLAGRRSAPPTPTAVRGAAAAAHTGGAAAVSGTPRRTDPWPDWARSQLEAAVLLARSAPHGTNVATLLHRDWFVPRFAGRTSTARPTVRPLAGVYRAAHAGADVRRTSSGLSVLARHDVVATDGWWRTWGESWTPPRDRARSMSIAFSPRPARLGAFVRVITSALLDSSESWLLGCAVSAGRMRRVGGAVLILPDLDALPDNLLDEVSGLLNPVASPLSAPLRPGAALTIAPTNGMTFGEHRCHLIALALRQPAAADDPLGAIASVFTAHGVHPAAPWRSR